MRARHAAPPAPDRGSPIATGQDRAAGLPPLVAALRRPEAFNHSADGLRLCETHISWVILAGPYAYKLKKPVALGFLDFTTVERRRALCEAEVRLNRRLCPDVYLGVVDVVERDGGFTVGGPGRPVEPAVWMRRLPQEGMLPAVLARDAAGPSLLRRIARRLAAFHAEAATGPGIDEYGSPAVVRANWEESFVQVAPFVGRTLDLQLHETIARFVRDFLVERDDLLERRVRDGRIRDGHGDLHAGNICVEGRHVQLFDCLEFAPRYRCADVAAEVAFLAMDLAHHGRADLGERFVDAYVRDSGDDELSVLLDFYACYRAYVRGKVLNLRLDQPGLSSDVAADAAAEAGAYFDLAWAYAGGLGGPTLIVTMGLPASGKTTLADALARRLGLVHVSSDVVRKRLAGPRPLEHRYEAFGRGIYGRTMTRRTYAVLRRRAAQQLKRGRSVVLDATFGHPDERAAVRRLARGLGARLRVLVCEADEATIQRRLAERARNTTTTSDARLDIWPALRAAYRAPGETEGVVHLDATRGPAALVRQVVDLLKA